MINGDQHLATVLQQGVETWGDAGYSFSVPSIVNHYRRWWSPDRLPGQQTPGELTRTGDYLDPFGNLITMRAYANPNPSRIDYDRWRAQGAGFGVIRFDKVNRTITMECWPRGCDLTDPDCRQYPGWPVVISQMDNYGFPEGTFLPTLIIEGAENPIIQILAEPSGDILYTLRIAGNRFRPPVGHAGTYTIRILADGREAVYPGVSTESGGGDALWIPLSAPEEDE
jgi:hypothetical protein